MYQVSREILEELVKIVGKDIREFNLEIDMDKIPVITVEYYPDAEKIKQIFDALRKDCGDEEDSFPSITREEAEDIMMEANTE